MRPGTILPVPARPAQMEVADGLALSIILSRTKYILPFALALLFPLPLTLGTITFPLLLLLGAFSGIMSLFTAIVANAVTRNSACRGCGRCASP